MTTVPITETDRDEHGRIRVTPETRRPLSDILPHPATPAPREPAPIDRRTLVVGGLVGLLLLAALIYFIPTGAERLDTMARSALPTAIVATPAGAAQPSQPQATAMPTAIPTGLTLPQATTAYDQPNGQPLGPLEAGRAYTVLGRYGSDWLLIDAVGSGGVSIRAADAGMRVDMALTDYAPGAAPAAPNMAIGVSSVYAAPANEAAPQTSDQAPAAPGSDAAAPPVPPSAPVNLADAYATPDPVTPLDRAIDAQKAANGDPCAGASPIDALRQADCD